jgi:hypothetical protein
VLAPNTPSQGDVVKHHPGPTMPRSSSPGPANRAMPGSRTRFQLALTHLVALTDELQNNFLPSQLILQNKSVRYVVHVAPGRKSRGPDYKIGSVMKLIKTISKPMDC